MNKYTIHVLFCKQGFIKYLKKFNGNENSTKKQSLYHMDYSNDVNS